MFEYCPDIVKHLYVFSGHFILGLLVDKRAQEKNNKLAEISPKYCIRNDLTFIAKPFMGTSFAPGNKVIIVYSIKTNYFLASY